jgi:hypothetical protein
MNRLRALDEKGKTKAKRIGEQRAKGGVHFLCSSVLPSFPFLNKISERIGIESESPKLTADCIRFQTMQYYVY